MPYFLFSLLVFLWACSLDNPAKATSKPNETDYCRWLLEELYLWELPKGFDSITTPESLFKQIEDPYTRYIAPPKAPESEESVSTSYSSGEIGIELGLQRGEEFPLIAYRIYPESPAAKANVPRFASLLSLNETSLKGDSTGHIYQSVLSKNDSVFLTYAFRQDTLTVLLKKEKIILPTAFLDTLSEEISVITLREFREKSYDQTKGTFGEIETHLNQLPKKTNTLIIDLRNNSGGSLKQCTDAADLFVQEGMLFFQKENVLYSDGFSRQKKITHNAKISSKGENLNIFLYTNGRTASCGEIFVMALKTGNSNVKTMGSKTFGKGIAQGLWKTPEGALLYITSMQIFDRFGDSYHGKGISPDFTCGNNFAECFALASNSNSSLNTNKLLPEVFSNKTNNASYGEAFIEGEILE